MSELIDAKLYEVDSYMLIIGGAAIMVITIIGLLGVMKEYRCLVGLVRLFQSMTHASFLTHFEVQKWLKFIGHVRYSVPSQANNFPTISKKTNSTPDYRMRNVQDSIINLEMDNDKEAGAT